MTVGLEVPFLLLLPPFLPPLLPFLLLVGAKVKGFSGSEVKFASLVGTADGNAVILSDIDKDPDPDPEAELVADPDADPDTDNDPVSDPVTD